MNETAADHDFSKQITYSEEYADIENVEQHKKHLRLLTIRWCISGMLYATCPRAISQIVWLGIFPKRKWRVQEYT